MEIPIKENLGGSPSLWYIPLVGGENFFDGFGFARYRKRFNWQRVDMDDREECGAATETAPAFPRKLEPKASFEMGPQPKKIRTQ